MKLEIVAVKNAGELERERVVLRANVDTDIGDYLIADTTYEGQQQVSDKLRHIFWLPDKLVSVTDLIVIYSKNGQNKTKDNEDGNRTHFIYWGLSQAIWHKNQDAITLFNIYEWDSKQIEA